MKICCCPFYIRPLLLGEVTSPSSLICCAVASMVSELAASLASGARTPTGLSQSTHQPAIQGRTHNSNQSVLMELWLDFLGQWPSLFFIFGNMRNEENGCSSHLANSKEVSLRNSWCIKIAKWLKQRLLLVTSLYLSWMKSCLMQNLPWQFN